jgi:hypothetical protein
VNTSKYLILLSLLASTTAFADSWYIENDAGGQIIITDDECWLKGKQFPSLHKAYARTYGGNTYNGCWYYKDGIVHVAYEFGEERTYPVNDFRKLQ